LYEITIAGVTNNGCDNCNAINDTWTLANAVTCFWEATGPELCTGEGTVTVQMVASGSIPGEASAVDVFIFSGVMMAQYHATGLTWDGTTPLIVPFGSADTAKCDNWPSDLTITPL